MKGLHIDFLNYYGIDMIFGFKNYLQTFLVGQRTPTAKGSSQVSQKTILSVTIKYY